MNANMLRNWKAEFLEYASSVFEERGKAEREAKRKEAAVKKERDKMMKTIGQLTIERNFLQACFRAVGQPIPEFDPENSSELSIRRQCELLHINYSSSYALPPQPNEEKRLL